VGDVPEAVGEDVSEHVESERTTGVDDASDRVNSL
jgi:hypothetical protein